MAKGAYQYMREAWKKSDEILKKRMIELRKQHTVERIEKPTRLDRARAWG